MNVPLSWEFKSNRNWGDDLGDFKWSMSSGCEFGCAVREWQVLSFEIYELSCRSSVLRSVRFVGDLVKSMDGY
jgi:hypothetical protein